MKKNAFFIFSALTALIIFLFLRFGNLLSPIFSALLLTYIAAPFVKTLSKRLPSCVAAVLFYLILLALLGVLTAFILPAVADGLLGLSDFIAASADNLNFISKEDIIAYLYEQSDSIRLFLSSVAAHISKLTVGVILSCFFLSDIDALKRSALSLIPSSAVPTLLPPLREIDRTFKSFFRGQLLDSAILTLITYLTLLILKIDYAAVLSLLYGIFCLVPTVGPFIGAIPVAAVSYLESPSATLFSVAAIVLTQVIDNFLLSPKIKADSVEISPAAAFIALYLGAGLLGFPGIILGVPLYASIKIILRRLLSAIV